ncbi:PadR family transcriptional regulator [Cellulomonas sp.]|uniref:PadR family transcriptional regulator n=1 Tax=Cellulomonas sp. TaxID=40001 RepID=UPI001AFD48D6|nr:PadR family transcriptional regulator [Cellulomonas sp.]MBO9555738.1 PadR family transcriptional regulator [Cellulomonas sp.]
MAPRTRNNPLALAVLALLWERPMHPYEMSMTLRERRKDESVRLNFGSLYSVVDSLVKHGLIEAASTEREGNRPTRTIYRLTDAGATEAVDWLSDLLRTPVKEFPQFEAALSFLPLLGPDDVARLLRMRVSALQVSITTLDAAREQARAQGLPSIFVLEADYDSALLHAELDFVVGLEASITDGTLEGVGLWRELHTRAAGGRLEPEEIAEALAPYFTTEGAPPTA